MPSRMEAAFRSACLLAVLFVTGCTTIRQQFPSRANLAPAPRPSTPLDSSPALAITNPPTPAQITAAAPAGDGEVKTVSFQTPSTPEDPARKLFVEAREAYSKLPSYIARLRRREFASGKQRAEEIIQIRFRESPWSVHFKWLGEEGRGREIVYVQGQYENKLHILTANNDIPLVAGGKRMSFALDSPLVKSASRYPITDAGIGKMIERYGKLLDTAAQPNSGTSVKSLGQVQRPEYPTPLDGVECTLPPGFAPEVPQGGKRLYFFDPTSHLPVVSITLDTAGTEVDFACFDRFQCDIRLDEQDFNPDKLWPVKK